MKSISQIGYSHGKASSRLCDYQKFIEIPRGCTTFLSRRATMKFTISSPSSRALRAPCLRPRMRLRLHRSALMMARLGCVE